MKVTIRRNISKVLNHKKNIFKFEYLILKI